MWDALRISRKADLEFATTVFELFEASSRSVILVVGGINVLYLLMTGILARRFTHTTVNVFVIIFLVGLVCVLAYKLLARRYLAAQIVWQAGLAVAITLAVYLLQRPEIAFLYAFLPMMAVVVIGWPASLAVEGLVIALAWLLPRAIIAVPSPLIYSLEIAVAGVLALGIGWASTHAFLELTRRSLGNLRNAQRRMDEALEQRVQLKQTQQDLVQANQELARLSSNIGASATRCMATGRSGTAIPKPLAGGTSRLPRLCVRWIRTLSCLEWAICPIGQGSGWRSSPRSPANTLT